uniref:AAA+ ATPase domain-containing protein n=1 Tax=Oryza rufipogon TaxID=4529 RepID=A0A0E0MZF7_ORYRU
MEHGSIIASAVGVGVGVGVGIGLVSSRLTGLATGGGAPAASCGVWWWTAATSASPSTTSRTTSGRLIEHSKLALTSTAFVHLSPTILPNHIRVLSASSRTILLCGPSEAYLQSLAKALANQFSARLLLLDVIDFACKLHHKYGGPSNTQTRERSMTEAAFDRVSSLVGAFNLFRKKEEPTGTALVVLITHLQYGFSYPWYLPRRTMIPNLLNTLIIVSASEISPVILYIRDVDDLLGSSEKAYCMFQKMLKKLSGRVIVIGSQFLDDDEDREDIEESVCALFPCILETKPPKDKVLLEKWKTQMEEDSNNNNNQVVQNYIAEVLAENNLECEDLSSINADDDCKIIVAYLEEIITPSVSYHLMNNKNPKYRNGNLVISSESLSHGLRIFQESNDLGKDTVEAKDETEMVVPDNEYEKKIRPTVIPANEIGVTFDDIGALADIKECLHELVMLPLQRPDFFKGGLLKPCKGVLLFGPPGTGKTMLAKALANAAGASFLNISMASMTSKWYGESEKCIQALFSLAAKLAPAIIFIDEVDSMLGKRDNHSENEASRRVKNEFMAHWDGLLSKSNERILVLAATNRPFDLDDAVIRRFEHRIMVGLPTLESRELILKTLLSKETVENIDFKELAKMTEGYTSSDLKNICVTAAYHPVRELLQKEKNKVKKETAPETKQEPKEKTKIQENGTKSSDSKTEKDKLDNKEGKKDKPADKKDKSDKGDAGETTLRPLNMEDLRKAKDEVAASFASEGVVMNQIKEWNELYGKGGSRKREQLTYFL